MSTVVSSSCGNTAGARLRERSASGGMAGARSGRCGAHGRTGGENHDTEGHSGGRCEREHAALQGDGQHDGEGRNEDDEGSVANDRWQAQWTNDDIIPHSSKGVSNDDDVRDA